MKKIIAPIMSMVLFVTCTNEKFIPQKVAEESLKNTLDGRVFLVMLVPKNKPDSNDFYVSEVNYSDYSKPLVNRSVVVSFQNGTIESSWVSDKKFESCAAAVSTRAGNITAFSDDCLATDQSVRAVWSGVVKGNNIYGTFSWLLPNTKMVSYYFRGTAVKINAKRPEGISSMR